MRSAHARLREAAADFGLALELGFELTPARMLLGDDLARYRLGDLPAVLLELPFSGPLELAEKVAEEIEAAGLTPVLAHPERADAVAAEPERVRRYRERGWLLQVNATSIVGYHGRESQATGWLLVERGLADLVGSDGHRTARPPFLDEAYAAVRRRIGERADELFDGSRLPARDRVDLAERR